MKQPRDPAAVAIATAKSAEQVDAVLEEAERQLRQSMDMMTNGKIAQWREMADKRKRMIRAAIIMPHTPGISLGPLRDKL
jgi:hypothetical protein